MIAKLFFRPKPLSPEEVAAYRTACETVARVLSKNGITHIRPYNDFAVPRLHAHRDPRRVLATLTTYAEVLSSADRDGDNLTDSKQLLWRMLRKLNYTPLSDIFEKIQSHNVLEIYTSDNWQVFRNLNFFQHVSMTIDEIATFYWPRDSKRDMKVQLRGLELATKIRFRTLRKTVDVRDWPAHMIRELVGEGWLIEIRLQYVSPLRGPNDEFLALVINESEAQIGGAKPSSTRVLPADEEN